MRCEGRERSDPRVILCFTGCVVRLDVDERPGQVDLEVGGE